MKYLKRLFIILLARVARYAAKRKKNEQMRILVVSTTGIGDTLWSDPFLNELSQLKNTKIDILTSSLGKEVLLEHPCVDCIHTLSKKGILSLSLNLFRKQYKQIYILHISQRLATFCVAASGCHHVIGGQHLQKDADCVITDNKVVDTEKHEVDQRLALLDKKFNHTLKLQWHSTHKESEQAEYLLKSQMMTDDDQLVIIHPGSSRPFKNWPVEYFQQVIDELHQNHTCFFLISAGPKERSIVDRLKLDHVKSYTTRGGLSFRIVAAMIGKAALMITNDTGPMHIAFAQGVPTIAIFGPTNPKLCGPYNTSKCSILAQPLTCIPCLKKACLDPFCLRQVDTKDVLKEAHQWLNH